MINLVALSKEDWRKLMSTVFHDEKQRFHSPKDVIDDQGRLGRPVILAVGGERIHIYPGSKEYHLKK
jgi:hypothetical protein